MDKLTALRVFRRIVERQSFSRAARDLSLSNAAVSKNLRELEDELGAPLIQRTTRRLHVTPLGESYLRKAIAILDALAEADRTVKDHATTPRGLLRVAAPMSLGLTGIAATACEFLVRHPDVKLDLDMSDRAVDLLREGFDVCIRGGGAQRDSNLVAKRLTRIDRIVVASPTYLARSGEPRSPAELSQHRCLVYSLSSSPTRWSFVKGTAKKSVEIDGPLRVNSSLAIVQGAVAGLGLAFVPVIAVERELAERRVVSVLREWQGEPQTLQAIYTRHRQSSPLVRRFVEHLADRLGRGP
jgi:DNA-binding transcriptional LysR family regulator